MLLAMAAVAGANCTAPNRAGRLSACPACCCCCSCCSKPLAVGVELAVGVVPC